MGYQDLSLVSVLYFGVLVCLQCYVNKFVVFHETKSMSKVPTFKGETFNMSELRHIAVNYAITCLHGYDGSFDKWFNGVSSDWREIANGDEIIHQEDTDLDDEIFDEIDTDLLD